MEKKKQKTVSQERDQLKMVVVEQKEIIERLKVDNLFLETLFEGIDE
ncbi:MAG: hypothetical protein P8Y00_04660 [Deltaproteobacteria bacterium]